MGYDSLLGDRQKLRGTYREFILPTSCFDGAYPEYIIIYKRRYDPPPSPHREKTVEKSPRPVSKSPRPDGDHSKSYRSPSPHSASHGYDEEEYLTRAASFLNYPGRPIVDLRLYINEAIPIMPGSTTVLVRGLQSRPELNGRVGLVKNGPSPNGRYYVDIIALTAVRRFICNADDSIYSHVDESIALKPSSII